MRRLLMLVSLLLAVSSAYAVDGVFFELGEGDHIDMFRVGMLWKWDKSWDYANGWHVVGAWEAGLGRFRGDMPRANDQTIADASITPAFRLEQKEGAGFSPYLEGGILGLHLISRAYAYDGRKLGSGFQFGHHIGFGVSFGERRQFGLGYRFQHLSNAGLVQPNPGINFNELHLVYYF